jgi:hypothetical protein
MALRHVNTLRFSQLEASAFVGALDAARGAGEAPSTTGVSDRAGAVSRASSASSRFRIPTCTNAVARTIGKPISRSTSASDGTQSGSPALCTS